MKNFNKNTYSNRTFQSKAQAQSNKLFLSTVFLSLIVNFKQVAKPTLLSLVFLFLTLVMITTMAQAQNSAPIKIKPEDSVVYNEKPESLFSSSTKKLLSFDLANQLAACTQSQISYGQTVFGEINTSDCVVNSRYSDEYTFNGTAGQQININFASGEFNTSLQLLNSNGTVLASATRSAYFPAQIVNYTLPSTGTYTIRASRLEQAFFYSNNTGENTTSL